MGKGGRDRARVITAGQDGYRGKAGLAEAGSRWSVAGQRWWDGVAGKDKF